MSELDTMTHNSKIVRITNIKDNFNLSKQEFILFKENVTKGDESIFLQLFSVQLPSSIIYLKNKFGISREIAHDVCMDTMIEFREKLINDKINYGNLRYLFTRMAVNNYLDSEKKRLRIQEAVNVFSYMSDISKSDSDQFFTVLTSAMNNLKPDQKKLLENIYQSGRDMSSLAEELGLSYANLRKRKQRILSKLKSNFFEKLK